MSDWTLFGKTNGESRYDRGHDDESPKSWHLSPHYRYCSVKKRIGWPLKMPDGNGSGPSRSGCGNRRQRMLAAWQRLRSDGGASRRRRNAGYWYMLSSIISLVVTKCRRLQTKNSVKKRPLVRLQDLETKCWRSANVRSVNERSKKNSVKYDCGWRRTWSDKGFVCCLTRHVTISLIIETEQTCQDGSIVGQSQAANPGNLRKARHTGGLVWAHSTRCSV